MEDLVTIKTANLASDLAIAKSYLESEGIDAVIFGEVMSQVYSAVAYNGGGVQLKVRQEDAENAIALLIEGGFAKQEDYEISATDKWLVNQVEKLRKLFSCKSKK